MAWLLDFWREGLRNWRWWLGALLLSAVAGLSLWDIIVVVPHPDQAVLRTILDFGQSHPALSVATGVLVGHWTWPVHRYQQVPSWKYWTLGVIGAAVLGLDMVALLPKIVPLVYVVAAVPLGRILWPQRVRL